MQRNERNRIEVRSASFELVSLVLGPFHEALKGYLHAVGIPGCNPAPILLNISNYLLCFSQ